jgi:hypothetical protein
MEKDCPELPPEPTRAKVTITLPPELIEEARPRWKLLSYGGFSAYVEQLIWQDLRDRPAHVRVREEPPSDQPPLQEKYEDRKKPDQTDKRIGFELKKHHAGLAMPLSIIAGVDCFSGMLI